MEEDEHQRKEEEEKERKEEERRKRREEEEQEAEAMSSPRTSRRVTLASSAPDQVLQLKCGSYLAFGVLFHPDKASNCIFSRAPQ